MGSSLVVSDCGVDGNSSGSGEVSGEFERLGMVVVVMRHVG